MSDQAFGSEYRKYEKLTPPEDHWMWISKKMALFTFAVAAWIIVSGATQSLFLSILTMAAGVWAVINL